MSIDIAEGVLLRINNHQELYTGSQHQSDFRSKLQLNVPY